MSGRIMHRMPQRGYMISKDAREDTMIGQDRSPYSATKNLCLVVRASSQAKVASFALMDQSYASIGLV